MSCVFTQKCSETFFKELAVATRAIDILRLIEIYKIEYYQ